MDDQARFHVAPKIATAEVTVAAPPNPWRTIWFSPQHTIRELIDAKRPSAVPLIILGAAVTYAVEAIDLDGSGQTISMSRSVVPLLIASVRIVLTFFIGPVILAGVGRWLRGQGETRHTFEAIGWSWLPFVASSCICMSIAFMVLGLPYLAHERIAELGAVEITESLIRTFVFLRVVDVVGKVWTLVLLVATVKEVHRFSVWRALVVLGAFGTPLYLLGEVSK